MNIHQHEIEMIGIKSGNGLQSVDRHLNLMVMTFQEIRGDALIHEPIFREQNAHRRRSLGVFIRSTPPQKKKNVLPADREWAPPRRSAILTC